jgi:hypothetical protein
MLHPHDPSQRPCFPHGRLEFGSRWPVSCRIYLPLAFDGGALCVPNHYSRYSGDCTAAGAGVVSLRTTRIWNISSISGNSRTFHAAFPSPNSRSPSHNEGSAGEIPPPKGGYHRMRFESYTSSRGILRARILALPSLPFGDGEGVEGGDACRSGDNHSQFRCGRREGWDVNLRR